MKKQIIIAFIAIAPILFMGCKKDKPAAAPASQDEEFVTSLKNWFELKTMIQPGKKDIRMGTPEWSKTKYYPESGFSVTPIKLGNKNTGLTNSVYKLLVTWENQQGMITSGGYIYIIPGKGSAADVPGMVMNQAKGLVSLDRVPENFNGTLMRYGLDYNNPVSKYYENGRSINRNEKIVAGKRDNYQDMNSPELYSAVLACGQCEDYYLVTYDEDGNIINIEYLYTECGDCTDPGGGGGGNNGGSNPSPCEMTQTQFEQVLNSMHGTVTNTPLSHTGTPSVPDQNGVIRAPKSCIGGGYTYTILSGYSPHWSSTYTGVVYKMNPNDEWKWESLSYTGFPQTSGNIPPCFTATATATSAPPVISEDKKKVTTAGTYFFHISWTCIFNSGSTTESGSFGALLFANQPCE